MISIKTFVFNPFQENTYILSDKTNHCVIIDPGCYSEQEKKQLEKYILDNHLICSKVLLTHCHVDHILGNNFLKNKYNPEIIGHQADAFLLNEAIKHGIIFGINAEQSPDLTFTVDDKSEITFGESKIEVLHVPGHSPGGIAFYSPEEKFILVGDVLFKGSIGRTDLPGGDYDVLMNSIYNKLMKLPPETIVYPGHGPFTTIHEEALSNPFLE